MCKIDMTLKTNKKISFAKKKEIKEILIKCKWKWNQTNVSMVNDNNYYLNGK